MTALPIDTSEQLRKAAQIAKEIGDGVQMIQNPVASYFPEANSTITDINAKLATLISSTEDSGYISALTSVQTGISDLSSSISGLSAHTESLIFGDSGGQLISSGLSGNLGMAVSAINLNDTMSSLAGPIVENCDLMQNFFGSVLGSGAELLGKIQSTIFGVLGTINGTIQSAVNAATGIVSQIQALTNQAIAMVTNEIAAFAEWIGKQMDFALGSFMASLGDISGCAGLVGDVVKTSALSNIL